MNIESKENQIVNSKPKTTRDGWGAAFAKYVGEGEDEMLLPDYLDAEAEELICKE